LRGLDQLKEDFIYSMAYKKKANWGNIWKAVKKIDKDSNGFVGQEELEELFREQFPLEMDGKTISLFLKKYRSI
jgi:hypothetical protein